MGSNNSKRTSIPITVSHPRLNSYYNEYTDENRHYISTVAMALNDSSTNLQSTPQQQNRPKMVVKSSQTSPMNRSVPQNLNTAGCNHNNSSTKNTPTGVYSVAKQHQSLQVKPRMGRSSLALDDNSNFLLGSNQNLRKPSMDSGSSQNSGEFSLFVLSLFQSPCRVLDSEMFTCMIPLYRISTKLNVGMFENLFIS